MVKIAFLGAGNMGGAMIRNLLKRGHDVRVFNRTKEKTIALGDAGATLCDTPREAAAGAAIIMSMLIDDDASRACWVGSEGALEGGFEANVLAIECSSVSPSWILELGQHVSGRMRLIDCPVAGRPDAAAAGTLKIFAGGDVDDISRAEPVLRAFASKVTRFGPLGSGVTFKLIYNMVGATQIVAVAEALYACKHAGIDMSLAAQALSEGNTGSPHITRHSQWMSAGIHPNPAQFSGEGRIKDLIYVREILRGMGLQSLVGEATLELFIRMRNAGIEHENDSRVIDAIPFH